MWVEENKNLFTIIFRPTLVIVSGYGLTVVSVTDLMIAGCSGV